jgi:hypothetical protein
VRGFPATDLAPYEIWAEFAELSRTRADELQTTLFSQATTFAVKSIGQRVANHFHKHIWEGHAINMDSPIQAFNKDKKLRRAIGLAKKEYGSISDRNLLTFLKFVSGTQACSNFRPMAARETYIRFPNSGFVIDPSTGYGGRLLGLLSLCDNTQYYGVDPNTKTHNANIEMVKFFGREQDVHLFNNAFEDLNGDELPNNCKLIFTSPPYFKKEIYCLEENQSCNRYKDSYESWLFEFWSVVLEKCFQLLADDGVFVINIQDVRISNKEYHLIADTQSIAEEIGYKLNETMYMRFAGYGKGLAKVKFEHVLVFGKGDVQNAADTSE